MIYAGEGNNIITGGTGNNTIYSGSGSDLFVLTPGVGSSTIINFDIGKDFFALTNGLMFEQLSITQGSRGNEVFTEISVANTGDLLATLNGVSIEAIPSSLFPL